MLKDADRFKIDLIGSLEKTLHGKVKPSMSPNFALAAVIDKENSDHTMLDATLIRLRERSWHVPDY